ncbi:MAG: hypothetical protein ACE5LS_00975 [Thermoplasmata archaeon]
MAEDPIEKTFEGVKKKLGEASVRIEEIGSGVATRTISALKAANEKLNLEEASVRIEEIGRGVAADAVSALKAANEKLEELGKSLRKIGVFRRR